MGYGQFTLNVHLHADLSSPFWTLSQSRKISSPPSTEPQVLSIREIFKLEALGDSAGEAPFLLALVSFDSRYYPIKSLQCSCDISTGNTSTVSTSEQLVFLF